MIARLVDRISRGGGPLAWLLVLSLASLAWPLGAQPAPAVPSLAPLAVAQAGGPAQAAAAAAAVGSAAATAPTAPATAASTATIPAGAVSTPAVAPGAAGASSITSSSTLGSATLGTAAAGTAAAGTAAAGAAAVTAGSSTVGSSTATAATLPAAPAPAPAADAPATRLADSLPRLDLSADGDGWLLSAEFSVPLTRSLEDAVRRGVPLYFVLEFELTRPRWWWTDERIAERSISYRLSYHALTRQFRLGSNGLGQNFDTLDEAVRTMSGIRGWRVMGVDRVVPGTRYEAQVRLRLDTSQLPKPFQISAITNRDWNPQSEWKRFTFLPQIPKSAP